MPWLPWGSQATETGKPLSKVIGRQHDSPHDQGGDAASHTEVTRTTVRKAGDLPGRQQSAVTTAAETGSGAPAAKLARSSQQRAPAAQQASAAALETRKTAADPSAATDVARAEHRKALLQQQTMAAPDVAADLAAVAALRAVTTR